MQSRRRGADGALYVSGGTALEDYCRPSRFENRFQKASALHGLQTRR
jgi:hypothetical protein